jgi:hypothetical protein
MFSRVRLLFLLLSVALFTVSCAGSSGYMKPSETLLSPTKEKALVRVMRPSGIGYAINFNIWDGGKVIGNSVAKSQFDYLTDPGKHLFVAIAENKTFLEAELEAGKTYYILTQVRMGMWKARVGFVPVVKGSEFWDKVKDYEGELNKLQPDNVALQTWENANKDKIQAILSEYETKLKTEEQWPKLIREDGR